MCKSNDRISNACFSQFHTMCTINFGIIVQIFRWKNFFGYLLTRQTVTEVTNKKEQNKNHDNENTFEKQCIWMKNDHFWSREERNKSINVP